MKLYFVRENLKHYLSISCRFKVEFKIKEAKLKKKKEGINIFIHQIVYIITVMLSHNNDMPKKQKIF